MFALVLSLLAPQTVYGDAICFDLEVGGPDLFFDDEVNEETNDLVCAWQEDKYHQRICQRGVSRNDGSLGCMYFPNGMFDRNANWIVHIHGSDALWVDKFVVWRYKSWTKNFGSSNEDGWCLSQDRNDHISWNTDDYPQHVPDNQCYYMVKLASDGAVYGWVTPEPKRAPEPKRCRQTRKMNCKQGCPSGWKHVDTSDHGCCSSWTSCGGNRKTCEREQPCRRRNKDADGETSIEVLPWNEEKGEWVQLSAPLADTPRFRGFSTSFESE